MPSDCHGQNVAAEKILVLHLSRDAKDNAGADVVLWDDYQVIEALREAPDTEAGEDQDDDEADDTVQDIRQIQACPDDLQFSFYCSDTVKNRYFVLPMYFQKAVSRMPAPER